MKRAALLIWISLLIVGAMSYANSFKVPFVFDDIDSIVENPTRRELNLALPYWLGTRAVVNMTFDLNYHYAGLNVTSYHAVNLFIHLATASAVFLLVYLITKHTWPNKALWRWGEEEISVQLIAAATAGLIFVLHPVQTQAVTYIVQRFASLTTLLYVLAVVSYLLFRIRASKAEKIGWAAISVGLSVVTMHAKETAITLPLAITGMEFVFFTRSWQWRKIGRRWLMLTPWLLTIFIIPFYMLEVSSVIKSYFGIDSGEEKTFTQDVIARIPDAAEEKSGLNRYNYFLTQSRVVATYWRLLLIPYGQHLDYYYPQSETAADSRVIAAAILHLAIISAGVWLWRKDYRLAAFGIGWWYLTLLPESSLVPITDVIFEHRMYLPMIGAVMIAAEAVNIFWQLAGDKKIPARKLATMVISFWLVLAATLGWLTWLRNTKWQSNVSIWRDSAEKSPEKGRPHNNLGLHLLAEDRSEEAMVEFKQAVEVDQDYAEPRNNMGMILIQKGRYDEAERELSEALRLKPDYSHALNNMGAIWMQRKDWPKAEEYFKQAVALDARYGGARDNLGMVLVNQGKLEEAREQLEINIKYNPDFVSSYNNLGVVYMRLGKVAEAKKLLEQALEINPNYKVAEQNLRQINGGTTKGMKVFR